MRANATSHSHGHRVVDLVLTLKNSRSEIDERAVMIKSYWLRTVAQLDFARRTWTGFSEEHQEIQLKLLEILLGKLKSAEHRVQGLIKKRGRATNTANERLRVRRSKYLFVKPYLDALISDLAKWQAQYEPTWYLIMKIANPIIDVELRRRDTSTSSEATAVMRSASKVRSVLSQQENEDVHIFLPADGLQAQQISRIKYSKAMLASRPEWSTPFLVDSIPCPNYSYIGTMAQDIRRLACKLRVADPATFGVLKCRGVVKWRPQGSSRITSFEMILETPSTHKPRTLRQYLISQPAHSLTDRVAVARRLAASVNYVHTLDFVHKNVRPDNLVSFVDEQDSKLGDFYLIGFEQVRSEDGRTYLRGSENWEQNIYRHPERQGSFPEERYTMQHDIYSLGVCLLEIGLWSSFVMYGDQDTVLGPGEALGLSSSDLRRSDSRSIKDRLVALAKTRLPLILGNTYTEVVLSCLTCLDGDEGEFGEINDKNDEDGEDEDGIKVGVKFIEQVLLKLNEISL